VFFTCEKVEGFGLYEQNTQSMLPSLFPPTVENNYFSCIMDNFYSNIN